MATVETIKFVFVPANDKLTEDNAGIVHYTRMKTVRATSAGWGTEWSHAHVMYCTEGPVGRLLDFEPGKVLTCLLCRGIYG